MKLYEKGVLSTRTLLDSYNVDIETEYQRKKEEINSGKAEVFVAPGKNNQGTDNNEGTIGRPTLDDSERQSDPGNSETGRNPKPSVPEGSEAQE